MERCDLLVIGAGAAGMSAALAAAETGASVLLAEEAPAPGGVLRQCLHHGFGLAEYGRELTGPEYAGPMVEALARSRVKLLTGVTVTALERDRTALLSGAVGCFRVGFRRCILAAGCRERTAESLVLAGTRPAGVFTAGAVQALMNLGHYGVGERAVILGSGDVGQIMARQLVQAGKTVVCLVEQNAALGGLLRNRRDCLEAYRIPVLLRTTVEALHGEGRLSAVTVRELDTGRRREIDCDTLVTALGLIPERELCRGLTEQGALPEWLCLCGNCDYVHDMVEQAALEGRTLGALQGRLSRDERETDAF